MLLHLLLFVLASAERIYLDNNRQPNWTNDKGPSFAQSEQIHLALGSSSDSLSVTWLTFDDTNMSSVQYGSSFPLNNSVPAKISLFIVRNIYALKKFVFLGRWLSKIKALHSSRMD
jgi:hypothetical protein